MPFTATAPAPPPAYRTLDRVRITGGFRPEFAEILTPSALAFVAELHRCFDAMRRALLARRAARQAGFTAGILPDFMDETRRLREQDWTVAPLPADLLDRRVEITGPRGAQDDYQ